MKELNKQERKLIKQFMNTRIPHLLENLNDEQIDFVDCYEIGFSYALILLSGEKIDPQFSPWGDGHSVIFEAYYTELLQHVLARDVSEEINNYCRLYLKILIILKNHSITVL